MKKINLYKRNACDNDVEISIFETTLKKLKLNKGAFMMRTTSPEHLKILSIRPILMKGNTPNFLLIR